MKKITLLLPALFLGIIFNLNAQKLASFEDLEADNLYLSDYGTSGDPFWYESDRFVEGGLPQIASNPSKSGINTSDKSLFAINVPDADWWGNFTVLGLKTPIKVTESNRYLHFKVYRSIQPKNFRIGFNDREEATEIFQGKVANDGQWESVVCDLGKFIDEDFEYIHIIHSTNWSDPRDGWGAATYAYDDFELSDSPIPPSVTLKDGNGLFIGFENQANIDEWVNEIDLLHPDNSAEIIDNPFEKNNLTENKIVKFNKSADASWWQGYRVDFSGVMSVGEDNPSTLHVLAYVPGEIFDAEPDIMNIDIQLCAKDHMGKENTAIFPIWDDEADMWHDLVMEMNSIQYLKEVTVRFDIRKNQDDEYINSPANTFYLDAIAFDKNPDPREIIANSVNKLASPKLASVRTDNGLIQIQAKEDINVEVYSLLGKRVYALKIADRAELPATTGIYLLKINSASNQEQIEKVLVK